MLENRNVSYKLADPWLSVLNPTYVLFRVFIIELIEQGQIQENKIVLSPSLAETFLKYWSRVTDRRPNIALPFFHLKSEGFWYLHANNGYKTALSVASQLKTASRIREVIAYASLDDEFFILLTDPHDREVIRQTLINTFLPNFKQVIESLLAENDQIRAYREQLLQRVEHTFSSQEPIESVQPEDRIRTVGFRQAIMGMYDYTCAVCELRIVTMEGESATDAAHIIPFSISRNDDVRNGVSLCKLHHWAFDIGLISLNKTYKVIVSELMSEQGPTEWLLSELEGKTIWLPNDKQLRPAQEALKWHRDRLFRE